MGSNPFRVLMIVVLLMGLIPANVQPVLAAAIVDPANIYVSNFEGWGTSLAWWANALNGSNRDTLADLIFGSNGLRLNIIRYNIGGSSAAQQGMRPGGLVRSYLNQNGTYDWTVDANQRWWVSAAASRGANIVEAFSNSPPWFMTINGDTRGASGCGDNVISGQEDAFAEYLTEVTGHFRDSWGVTFRTLNPLNEPNATWWCGPGVTSQEGTHIGRAQQSILVQRVGEKLVAKGLTGTKVSAPDESSPGETSGSINAYSGTARGYVAQINTHTYGGNAAEKASLKNLSDSLGKRLWMSEVDGTAGSAHNHNDIVPSLWLAARITEDVNTLKPAAWVFWQIIEEENAQASAGKNWGAIHAQFSGSFNYSVTKKYYALGNYTRFIRPGYQIIASGDSRAVAAYSPSASTLVLVIYNNTASSSSVTWDLTRFGTVTGPATAHRTSAGENLVQLATTLPISNKQFTATANANSITTYVIPGVSGVGPTPTPTATPVAPAFPAPGVYYRLINRNSGKVADVSGGSTADGADVVQWTSNGGTNQQWQFVYSGGYYTIVNRRSGKLMDISGGSTADGGDVIQWPGNGGTNQQWTITSLGSGYYRFTNRKSGKVMDVSSASTADGGDIIQWASNGGTNQQWQIVP